MNCRWKDKDGNHQYNTFIPEVDSPVTFQDVELPEPQAGEKRKPQSRRPTDKGALYYKYDHDVHKWLMHICRAH